LVGVSATQPSRIAIEGAKILSAVYDEAELSVTPDKDNGQLFVRPLAQRPVSLFVVTSLGTYALLLEPKDVVGQNIVLKADARRQTAQPAPASNGWTSMWRRADRRGGRESGIKRVVFALARGQDHGDVTVRAVAEPVALWRETEFVRVAIAEAPGLRGEMFKLRNISRQALKLAEAELYKPGVVAVAIDKHELQPDETTDVWIVMEGGDG
ncbi:MAG TPA: type-F conjugative transfer system secretin TraK, partial [Burkholderiaceae bacterium]|nr:type-F conjugative transfer system secretin TraK [Burkholderiaceae bacterium]